MSKVNKLALIPVMLCFFCMGFVDLVGIASNYVKEDLALNDSTANIFPSLVFFWFLIFSVPTGMLMNKIGRKKTVLLSLGVTECTDADLTESIGIDSDGWGQSGIDTHLRTIYQGNCLIPGALSGHVGCYTDDTFVRLRLAYPLWHLLRHRHPGYCFVRRNTY